MKMSCALIVTMAVLASGCGGSSEDTPEAEARTTNATAQLDACELLMAANPSEVLGGAVDEPIKAGVQCVVSAQNDYLKSASLALPSASGVATEMTRERFFEVRKEGLEILGIGQDDLHEVDGLGSFALYAESDVGMQLWFFWGEGYSAIINLNGVDADNGLDWAKTLAQSVTKAS